MYKKVYFRINTPIYYKSEHGVGFEDQQDSENFHTEALNIFLNDGWQVKEKRYKNSGICSTVIKDKQELYLHPQEFTGVVIEENIPYIEQLISNSNLFKFETTDIYEDVFDITDDEYLNILKSKRTYIEQDLLEVYKTKRSNLYITSDSISKVLNKYKIKRLTDYIGVYSSDDFDWQYMEEIFKVLIKEGRIVSAETKYGIGYRTDKRKTKVGIAQ